MDYRSFITEKARAGDSAAQRVLTDLTRAARETGSVADQRQPAGDSHQRRAPQSEQHGLSLSELRARLDVIRAEEEARHESARIEREGLERVAPQKSLDEVLAGERQRIYAATDATTALTDAERMRLRELAGEKRSWNPLTRVAAAHAEEALRAARQSRYEMSLRAALEKFERRDVPQYAEHVATDERRYRQYVTNSLALEDEMREARAVLRERLPQVEERLSVLERGGASRIDAASLGLNARLNDIAAAVERQYLAMPEETRRGIERSIRRDHRARDRSLEYIAMGGR